VGRSRAHPRRALWPASPSGRLRYTALRLRCEEIPSLVAVAKRSDAVLLAIRLAAPDLVPLNLVPALGATARFGLVTLARRTEPPGLAFVRTLMAQLLRDGPDDDRAAS
ncbi:MAG: DUF1902 domain-containing protein, partial [Burkholderiaceae bacterium]|nr:DUF1902 domain-containing protein [Burkholderiaceae bacterium]